MNESIEPSFHSDNARTINPVSWRNVLVQSGASILEAVRLLDNSAYAIVCVTDANGCLLGTVTDGDVRRGLLRGIGLSESVNTVMNMQPISAPENTASTNLLQMMDRHDIRQIPLLDANGVIVGLEVNLSLQERRTQQSAVLLMAGGMGKRLLPLTESCPKPMLKIGSKPVLETILERFIECGFNRFYISVNYMAHVITDYFGDGSKWGVSIEYLHEESTLGTAGPLGLLSGAVSHPILVMNGDVLTKVDFRKLLDFHDRQNSFATMCVREVEIKVPYGVVTSDGSHIRSIEEKPVHRFFANAGIYVFDSSALTQIPQGQNYNMDIFIQKLIAEKRPVNAFPLREYWLDIGRIDDFQQAEYDFQNIFKASN